MAEKDGEGEVALAPETAPLLERANVAWLEPVRSRLDALQSQGRMPHGLLLTGPTGAGQAEIATWLAARCCSQTGCMSWIHSWTSSRCSYCSVWGTMVSEMSSTPRRWRAAWVYRL